VRKRKPRRREQLRAERHEPLLRERAEQAAALNAPVLPWWAVGPLRQRRLDHWARRVVRSGLGPTVAPLAEHDPAIAHALRRQYEDLLADQEAAVRDHDIPS